MTKLLKIQQEFAQHIFNEKQQQILEATIYSKVEALERLSIYRNNIFGNFESVLSSIYPISKKIISENTNEKNFAKLLLKFYQKFPSRDGDLNNFGSEFPQFIKSLKPSYLKDLAQIELFYHQSYFTAQSKTKFDLEKFKKVSSEDFGKIIFTIADSAVLFSSKFAVFSIWKKEQKIKNYKKTELMLIHRNKILLLNQEEYLFLSLIKQQKPLYKIYQKLCKNSEAEVNIGALINDFVTRGIITKFDL